MSLTAGLFRRLAARGVFIRQHRLERSQFRIQFRVPFLPAAEIVPETRHVSEHALASSCVAVSSRLSQWLSAVGCQLLVANESLLTSDSRQLTAIFPDSAPHPSPLNTIAGSTRVACEAGQRLARTATSTRTTAPARIVGGSVGDTPKSSPRSTRPTTNAPARPKTIPIPTGRSAWLRINR